MLDVVGVEPSASHVHLEHCPLKVANLRDVQTIYPKSESRLYYNVSKAIRKNPYVDGLYHPFVVIVFTTLHP